MTRATGIALVVLALIGCGAWYVFEQNSTPVYVEQKEAPGQGKVGTASTSDPYDVVFTFSDDGVTPREISIIQGQRVRFLNKSTSGIWPASGVHPTHTLYPEKEPTDCLGSSFDSCAEVAPGGYFDFTFNYLGTWPFHDHLHAFNTGRITVVAH